LDFATLKNTGTGKKSLLISLIFAVIKIFFGIGTDVWLYAVDPGSEELLWYNSSLLETKMTGRSAQTNLKYVITGDLHLQVITVSLSKFLKILYILDSPWFNKNFLLNMYVHILYSRSNSIQINL
jgi:hypothetical protein